eukprot:COSAG02_NODE_50067_length_323_cov_0.459821_1_plen_36_part_01
MIPARKRARDSKKISLPLYTATSQATFAYGLSLLPS